MTLATASFALDRLMYVVFKYLVEIGEQLVQGEARDVVSSREADVRRDRHAPDVLAWGVRSWSG